MKRGSKFAIYAIWNSGYQLRFIAMADVATGAERYTVKGR